MPTPVPRSIDPSPEPVPAPGPDLPPQPGDPGVPGRSLVDRLRDLFVRRRLRPGRVAIVRLYGSIGGGGRNADWVETIRRLRRNGRVPAVVVDIDSPGGSAAASDYLFLALQRLALTKPVVAHVRGIGASGSYLAAMATHRLVVAPSSVIGSIGVISAGPRVPALLDRLGVRVEEHRAGRLKGMGAPWREDTEEERAREQQLVDAFYDRFVERVAAGRKLARERVLDLATGEVWLGTEAVELGLADEIGDLDRAIEVAAVMAGVPAEASPVRLPRSIMSRLVDRFATRVAASIVREATEGADERLRARDSIDFR